MNGIETKKTIQSVNQTKNWFFENNQQDKLLAEIPRRQKGSIQIKKTNKINKKGRLTTDSEEDQKSLVLISKTCTPQYW